MELDVDWYRTFFEGIVLDMWRRAVPAERTRAEADFLERALAHAGLRTRALYSSIEEEPYEVKAPCLIIIAERS